MKTKILFSLLLLSSLAYSEIKERAQTCFYIDGYWSEWKWSSGCHELTKTNNEISGRCYKSDHPADFAWRVKISQCTNNNQNGWAVYSGTLEYYIDDVHPNLRSILKDNGEWVNPKYHSSTPYKKITVNATIKIQKIQLSRDVVVGYNFWGTPKYGEEYATKWVYNIFTNEGGFGISFIDE